MTIRLVALITAIALALAGAAPAGALTLEEERKLGQNAFREVMMKMRVIEDPDIASYIQKLGKRLVDARPDDRFKYRFFVIDDSQINAFAMPGGWICFYRGLITSMKNEGELAGVMAHEMSHVYYRHIAKRMDKAGKAQMASLAGMVAGILLGVLAGAPQLGQAMTMGSMAGNIQAQLSYSREDERQADFGAFKVLEQAHYDPKDMAATFERMWQQQRMTSHMPPAYLLTHPTSAERIDSLRNMAMRNPFPVDKHPNDDFRRIQARLMALFEDPMAAENHFRIQLKNKNDRTYGLYGMSLISMRANHYPEALGWIAKMGDPWPKTPYLEREKGSCYLAMGEYQKARNAFNLALAADFKDPASKLGLGQVYLRTRKYEQAREVLEPLVEEFPHNSQARYDLGLTLGKMGRTGQASLQLGYAFFERRNLRMARYHFNKAREQLAKGSPKWKEADKALNDMDQTRKKKAKPRDKGPKG